MSEKQTAMEWIRQNATPNPVRDLVRHILAMENDAYLSGHPEWAEIVKDAKKVREK